MLSKCKEIIKQLYFKVLKMVKKKSRVLKLLEHIYSDSPSELSGGTNSRF